MTEIAEYCVDPFTNTERMPMASHTRIRFYYDSGDYIDVTADTGGLEIRAFGDSNGELIIQPRVSNVIRVAIR